MEVIVAAAILGAAIVGALGRRQRHSRNTPASPAGREELVALEERVRRRAAEHDRRARELDDQTRALEA